MWLLLLGHEAVARRSFLHIINSLVNLIWWGAFVAYRFWVFENETPEPLRFSVGYSFAHNLGAAPYRWQTGLDSQHGVRQVAAQYRLVVVSLHASDSLDCMVLQQLGIYGNILSDSASYAVSPLRKPSKSLKFLVGLITRPQNPSLGVNSRWTTHLHTEATSTNILRQVIHKAQRPSDCYRQC